MKSTKLPPQFKRVSIGNMMNYQKFGTSKFPQLFLHTAVKVNDDNTQWECNVT